MIFALFLCLVLGRSIISGSQLEFGEEVYAKDRKLREDE